MSFGSITSKNVNTQKYKDKYAENISNIEKLSAEGTKTKNASENTKLIDVKPTEEEVTYVLTTDAKDFDMSEEIANNDAFYEKNASALGLTNDIDGAMEKYSAQMTDENADVLRGEVEKGRTDITSLDETYQAQADIISSAQSEASGLESEISSLESERDAQQATVDEIKNAIIAEADAKIAELDADTQLQNQTIENSKNAVAQGEANLASGLAAQDSIISSETPNLSAMKTITKTDSEGNEYTEEVPDEEARAAARSAISAAQSEKSRLQSEFAAMKAQEEEIQANATQKIEENAKARAEQDALKANPQSDELTAATQTLDKIKSEISSLESSLSSCESDIAAAEALQDICTQLKEAVTFKISQSDYLLSQKQRPTDVDFSKF